MKASEPLFSPDSVTSGALKPNKRIASSSASSWRALLLDIHEGHDSCDAFDTHPTPDFALVVGIAGSHRLESFRHGCWRSAVYQPGTAGIVRGGDTARLKWASMTPQASFQTAHLYLPSTLIAEIGEEFRRAGSRNLGLPIAALAFRDPVVAQSVLALERARRAGQPDLYAEHMARWLIAHLMSVHAGVFSPADENRRPGVISDRRLTRAIEYMSDRLDADIQVSELAAEAGISVHHFGRVFQTQVGRTPHAFITDLRIELAQRLLSTTDLPLTEVAHRCGYLRPAAFGAIFRKRVGETPGRFREARACMPISQKRRS